MAAISIPDVILWCSKIEMIRPYTRSVVASVKNPEVFRNRAVGEIPSDVMRVRSPTRCPFDVPDPPVMLSYRNAAITSGIAEALPFPAIFINRFLSHAPEPLKKRETAMRSGGPHAAPPFDAAAVSRMIRA
jgi:hypothetical protein